MSGPVVLSRREFVFKTSVAAGGLVLGTRLGSRAKAWAEVGVPSGAPLVTDPSAFVRIAADDTVTVWVKHIEFGQGVYTGLTTLVAEELDADWSQMRAEAAPADARLYLNAAFGVQGTGGSTAIANSYMQMRKVGASARQMLVRAAAKRLKVPASRITVEQGQVRYGKKSFRFGELAEEAMALPVPNKVRLKSPRDFKLIGQSLSKPDTASKLTGAAKFTIDLERPKMLTVLVKHPEHFGATLKSFDAKPAEAVKGFVAAEVIPEGLAVYAEGYWAAARAQEKISVEWDNSKAETRGTEELIEAYSRQLEQPGPVVASRGRAPKESSAAKTLSADYVFPYLAHAPMEPLDVVLERTEDGAEAWFGSQLVTADHQTIAATLGLDMEQVKLNVVLGGGSFGRRAQANCHLAKEGAEALKVSPDGRPIKLVWTREDDIKGGYYRPLYVHRLEATVGENNQLASWRHRIVGQSILKGSPFEALMMKDGYDPSSTEGATDLPYAIPHFRVELHTTEVGIPVLWWRSVGSTHTGFSTEAFMDEVLELAGQQDPVDGRLALIKKDPRHRGVLERVAEISGWPKAAPGRALGVALHKSFGTYVAQVAEVGEGPKGLPKIHKVWCAVDCGVAVNPNIIAAQMEGGIGYGLGAALYNEIELVKGQVMARNFDDYLPLRMEDMPEVEVAVIASTEPPTGVGEPAVPLIGPAVANAFRRLTGRKTRRLPFTRPTSTSGAVS